MINMEVSVIISSYSSKRYNDLKNILEALNNQTYQNREVIIVIDEDHMLLTKLDNFINENNFTWVKLVFNHKNRGLSFSRNLGIAKSSGKVYSFIDDDAIPTEGWIESIISSFYDSSIGAVTGNVFPIWEDRSLVWFPLELHWMISCSYIMTPTEITEVERGFGVNMSFRKEVVDHVGLFNTHLGLNNGRWLGGEDTEMFQRTRRAGWKVLFNPAVTVLHKVDKSRLITRNLIMRAYSGGASVAALKKLGANSINQSTETQYLSRIVFESTPRLIRNLNSKNYLVVIHKLLIIWLVIAAEIVGYFYVLYIKGDNID